jgi:putative transposase
MSRPKRITLGGYVYHVLNRANGRLRIFRKKDDFLAFENILAEGIENFQMRICGYCVMPNHWHLLLWPRNDGDLSEFMRWTTLTHVQRFHSSHGTTGIGHLYQGRYKSFPVQDGAYYLTAMRYIEANPLRAGIVKSAANWPWSSFSARLNGESIVKVSRGPLKLPPDWPALVHRQIAEKAKTELQISIKRSSPMGQPEWIKKTAIKMNLQSTTRPRGRPKKSTEHL